MSDVTKIELPWPPSMNTYWRRVGNKTILSKAAREYKKAVAELVLVQFAKLGLKERAHISIIAYPPDKRVRDLDNLLKPILDAMTGAGVWVDDGIINSISIQRSFVEKEKGGLIVAHVGGE